MDVDTAPTERDPRRHQLRIAVRSSQDGAAVEDVLAPHLAAAMSIWSVEPLGDDVRTHLVTGQVDAPLGSDAYARRAHTLVQRLLDTRCFSDVEADVPVLAFEDEGQGAFGDAADQPGTSAMDWARKVIRWGGALEVVGRTGRAPGAGVLVGHPDTGYTLHPRLGRAALDLDLDWDAIARDDDAADPLVPPDRSPWPVPSPGHGTKTGSVIAGRGSERTGVVGVAPAATLVPIRAVESVVQLFDSDVARSIDHARRVGCHVISMSLGGKGFFGLREAISRAVDSGMIVMAAAGNKVGVVVAPASYDNCIAVAATGLDDSPWPGTSRGRAVDVSAPGWSVHVASFDWTTEPPRPTVARSSGTSYAVAHLAGVAALWLGHHGVDQVRQRYGGAQVQAAFLHLLRQHSRVPQGWDPAALGVGVLDAEALLRAPLPDPDEVPPQLGAFGATDDPCDRLSALVDTDRATLCTALEVLLGVQGDALDAAVRRFEGELAYLLLEDADFRAAVLAAPAAGAFGPVSVAPPAAGSPDLARALAAG